MVATTNEFEKKEGSILRSSLEVTKLSLSNVLIIMRKDPTKIFLYKYINFFQTGVDISPAMIEHATGEHQNPGLCFKVADFGSQHMASILGAEHFSKVFSFFCLHWIHDQRWVKKRTFFNLLNTYVSEFSELIGLKYMKFVCIFVH